MFNTLNTKLFAELIVLRITTNPVQECSYLLDFLTLLRRHDDILFDVEKYVKRRLIIWLLLVYAYYGRSKSTCEFEFQHL